MKKYLIVFFIVSFCITTSAVCFAAIDGTIRVSLENPYEKIERVNTVCRGINGEEVVFVGERDQKMPEIGTMNLQVKNGKTGKIDLNLTYTARKCGLNFSSIFSISRIDLEKKSFWVVEAKDDGPKYIHVNNIWIIGEYEGKYVVFLTEKILGDSANYHFIHAGFGTFETSRTNFEKIVSSKRAIAFSNDTISDDSSYHTVAFWDDQANWFGYSNVADLANGADIVRYGEWKHVVQ